MVSGVVAVFDALQLGKMDKWEIFVFGSVGDGRVKSE